MAELLSEHRDHQAGGGARGRGVEHQGEAALKRHTLHSSVQRVIIVTVKIQDSYYPYCQVVVVQNSCRLLVT